MEKLRDVQNEKPVFNVKVDRVGVRYIQIPIKVEDKKNKVQSTVASINMSVCLPNCQRGTHMSRFTELIHLNKGRLSLKNIKSILRKLKKNLNASEAFITISFPYFLEKEAPVSKIKSLLKYDITYDCALRKKKFSLIMKVKIPVMTLCPCSKAISEKNAHNQRAYITLTIDTLHFYWLEDFIEVGENAASSPLYTTLKRPDEKYITEHSYDKPRFVEDVARDVAAQLESFDRIKKFTVEVESMESIHNHSAYAMIEYEKNNRH